MVRKDCLFKKDHHVRIATILQSLDAEILFKRGCFFGGGTAIVLSHGEYRESVDIDFLISDLNGYRELRQDLKGASHLSAIVRDRFHLDLVREVRADQYGIRTMLNHGGEEIKFEIVFESRVILDIPSPSDSICGIATLTLKDMAVSKLLANSDRWSDDAVFSRDLIDLSMLDLSSEMLIEAIQKAEIAYGKSIVKDLGKAIESLKNRSGRLSECMSALKMNAIPEVVLWDKIRKLKKKLKGC